MKKRAGWLIRGAFVAIAAGLFLLGCFSCAATPAPYDAGSTDLPKLAATQTPVTLAETAFSAQELIRSGHTFWRYLDEKTDPAQADDRLSWTLETFDDSGWKEAVGSFGAKEGELSALGTVAQPDNLLNHYGDSGNALPVYFFRAVVNIDHSALVQSLLCSIRFDDAIIVYLNGVAVYSDNVSPDGYASNLSYGSASSFSDPIQKSVNIRDVSMLHDGANVIAVELHQCHPSSSDIYFDFEQLTTSDAKGAEQALLLNPLVFLGRTPSEVTVSWFSAVQNESVLRIATANREGAPLEEFTAVPVRIRYSDTTGFYAYSSYLTGLHEGSYAYCIENAAGKSDVWTLHIGSAQSEQTSFLFAGDPQILDESPSNWGDALAAALAADPDAAFLLIAGDLVNDGTMESQFTGFASAPGLRSYPMATAIGNHDEGALIYEHLLQPNFDSESGDFYFYYGSMLVVAIDSNRYLPVTHASFVRQAALQYEKDNGTEPNWTILLAHHSVFAGAQHEPEEGMLRLQKMIVSICTQADVDLILSGHEHIYSRSYVMAGDTRAAGQQEGDRSYKKSSGQTLYVSGGSSSGTKYYDVQQRKYSSIAFAYYKHEPTMVEITATKTTLKISLIRTKDAKILDRFTLEHTPT